MPVPSTRAQLVLSLFDGFYERVYAFLRKSTTPEVAEDLAQEVFVRLLQHPELERLTISVSYLLKIAHNLLRRRYARANRLRELLSERHASGGCPEASDDADVLIAVDGDVLQTAMGLLTSDEHSAVRLIVCEGRSYQHAARSLGVTVTTINNWKHRGLSKMRRYLADAVRGNCAGHHSGPGYLTEELHAAEVQVDEADSIRSSPASRREPRDVRVGQPARRSVGSTVGPVRSEQNRFPSALSASKWFAASDDVA
ncbi:MAG: sigma-70 family RNA polymerase sigma factor [Phycisphaerae bacterium]|jgi:RNA polymerase sigma factor (sigma-70 family)|nr:sigma-70 family RNA polymerase sigma factor [Phycisphaerae bacterium]